MLPKMIWQGRRMSWLSRASRVTEFFISTQGRSLSRARRDGVHRETHYSRSAFFVSQSGLTALSRLYSPTFSHRDERMARASGSNLRPLNAECNDDLLSCSFFLRDWSCGSQRDARERRSSRTTHPDRRDVLPDLVAMRNCKSLKPSEPFFRSVNPLSLIVGIRSKTSKLR